MSPDDAIARILDSLREALTEIPRSIEALREREVSGESANGAVRIFYGALGELKRIEVEPDFLRSTDNQRIEQALLEAFTKADRAAAAARTEFQSSLTFMGISIGQAVQGGSISGVLPTPSRISEVFDQR
jgi:DNA-binding protein YbaB